MIRRSKYRNKPTEVDGLKFDSLKEARRYGELKLMQRAGEIEGLCADKKLLRFAIVVNGLHVCNYEADFCYTRGGVKVIEDCKGMRTPEYVLKRKLMWACHNIEITET